MKSYNVDAVDYRFWLLPPDGVKMDLTGVVGGATFTGTKDNLVDTVDLHIKNQKFNGRWLHADLYLARRLLIEARDEDTNWTEIFRGTFTKWQTNAFDKTVNCTASDGNNLIMSNDIIRYFPKGTAESRVKTMLSSIGMPVGSIDAMGVVLSKELVKSQIATKIMEYKEKSEEKNGIKTVVRNNKGKFEIVRRGTNKKIFVIDSWGAQNGTDVHIIPSDFSTIVKVYGSAKGDKVPPLQSTVSGDTQFGKHTKIIYSSDYDNATEASVAAKNIIKNQGKPEKTQTVKGHVDIPFLQVGDAIDVIISTIASMKDGVVIPVRRYVSAISRDFVNKTMDLELEE